MPDFSPLALPTPIGPVLFVNDTLLAEGIAASRASRRGRIMRPLQRDNAGPVQRLLNFMQPGSYVQPHCHPAPHAIETAMPLQGAVHLWIFDENGRVMNHGELRAGIAGACLADWEPGVWHTFSAIEPDTVVLEIKRGPYDAATDKQFATWAPREGSAEAAAYLAGLPGMSQKNPGELASGRNPRND